MRQQRIEERVRKTPCNPLGDIALALDLIAIDDVNVIGIELGQEARQQRRILFKITVNQEAEIAVGVLESGHQRLVVTEIARQLDYADAAVVVGQPTHMAQ